MRKRRAIALFGGFSILLLAYFGWCVSPIFLEPKFVFEGDIPSDARAVISEWRPYKSSPSAKDLFQEIMQNLANPYTVSRLEVYSWYHDENTVFVYLMPTPFTVSAKRKNGKWVVGSYNPVIVQ